MTNAKTTQTTLILGGGGKTGRRVAERLAARGLPVRMASRSSAPSFDWHDERTWAAALHGVDAAYLTYFPDGRPARDFRAFAQTAAASGAWQP